MNVDVYDTLLETVTPFMSDLRDRRAIVRSALWGTNIINQIDFSGQPDTFTAELLWCLELQGSKDHLLRLIKYLLRRCGEGSTKEKLEELYRLIDNPEIDPDPPPQDSSLTLHINNLTSDSVREIVQLIENSGGDIKVLDSITFTLRIKPMNQNENKFVDFVIHQTSQGDTCDIDGDSMHNEIDNCPTRVDEAGFGVDGDSCPYYNTDADDVYDRDDNCSSNKLENLTVSWLQSTPTEAQWEYAVHRLYNMGHGTSVAGIIVSNIERTSLHH